MVPFVLSIKDTLLLKDAMSWNLQTYKKLSDFEQITTDVDVRNAVEKLKEMHKGHYEAILTIIKECKN